MAHPPQVVVVGGGFGGLYCARRLEARLPTAVAKLVLVNPENYLLFTPLLPEAASGTIEPRHVVVPIRRVLKRTQLLLGEVTYIDVEARTVTVLPPEGLPRTIEWDRLVFAPGAVSRMAPIPGLGEHAFEFKTLADGIGLRNHVLHQLEMADAATDPAERAMRCTFVVVGAGYAGTEVAAELQVLTMKALKAYTALRPQDIRWIIVDAAPRVLPELGDALGTAAVRVLQHRGIEVRLQTTLQEVGRERCVLSDGSEIATRTVVWTAGVEPSPLTAQSGLPADERGRVPVDEHLEVLGVHGVWALGDSAAVPLPNGETAPPTAQHALREAKVAADNIAATFGHGRQRQFSFRGIGLLVNLGGYNGVGLVFGLPISGFLGWFVTRSYHLLQLPTWGRRVRVAFDWTAHLLFPQDIAELGSLGRAPRRRALR